MKRTGIFIALILFVFGLTLAIGERPMPSAFGQIITPGGGSSFSAAAPGPIGGTTPSTGQFTTLGVGTAPLANTGNNTGSASVAGPMIFPGNSVNGTTAFTGSYISNADTGNALMEYEIPNGASFSWGINSGQNMTLGAGGISLLVGGAFLDNEGSQGLASGAGKDVLWADATAHSWKTSLNNGAATNLVRSGMFGSSNAVVSNSAANFFPASGTGAPVASTSEGVVSTLAPWAATIQNMKCGLYTIAGVLTVAGGTNYVVALRQNIASSAITCTIATAASSCTDTTHSITTAIGDQLDFIDTPTGTPTALVVKCSVEVDF